MIDVKETIALLERAVAERGEDYIYPVGKDSPWRDDFGQCLYRNSLTGEPACIVGLVASYVDPNVHLNEFDSVNALSQTWMRKNLTDDAIYALRVAQTEQDAGFTWGDALRAVKRQLT